MIIDSTGIILTPGNGGKDCMGNGLHIDSTGKIIEACCDECDYLKCCTESVTDCAICDDINCPRFQNYKY